MNKVKMKLGILKFVFFSIIICSFEYAKNELYYVNETSIYLERNLIYFGNNRILTDADNQLDLNYFYESIVSLADQHNNINVDNKDITNIQNLINSHINKCKESNTLPNLNNVDEKTKKEIRKLQKELKKVRKEVDNIRNDKLAIQPIQDKRIIIKCENVSIPNYEGLNGLEYLRSITSNEPNEDNTTVDDILESKREQERRLIGLIIRGGVSILLAFMLLAPVSLQIAAAIISALLTAETFVRCYQYVKLSFKIAKMSRKEQKKR
ncbi:fam-b protein [Plasmodium vinckei vinckei]|uniref:Fam-b protein n=1 Tax=Plasmodium vinckei vinckei TaxID=54757 RepID=A0A449BXH0_PLAVN|nr:fam-b protein [Plasmodium vinckei vinckei]VEV58081.1 fam-b protein [Plasmodium vinckei vinckei]